MDNRTAAADRKGFKDINKKASDSDVIFKTFKQHPDYTPVLEHMNYDHGVKYRNWIIDNNLLDESKFEKFKENDIYGTPSMYNYDKPFGKISPSTLRYVKILNDLVIVFGNLTDFNIVEIGGGYGGQAKIIMDYFNVKEYNFIDLPEVIALTKKYLGKFDYDNLNFLDFNNLPDKKYDLVISNYAISECTAEMQQVYIDKIINNTTNGYMIMNTIVHRYNIVNYTQKEWISKIPNVKLYSDTPICNAGNYILIFKK